MARTQAVYYRDSRGAEPVDEFIQALPPRRAAKIDEFIEEHLNGRPQQDPPPTFPVTSQIDGEIRELRVRFANTRYGILYQRSENLVALLHAIEKDTGAVSRSDIELARQRMADFKRRMDASRRTPTRAAGRDVPASRPVASTYQERILAGLDEQLLIGIERTTAGQELEREIAPAPEVLSA